MRRGGARRAAPHARARCARAATGSPPSHLHALWGCSGQCLQAGACQGGPRAGRSGLETSLRGRLPPSNSVLVCGPGAGKGRARVGGCASREQRVQVINCPRRCRRASLHPGQRQRRRYCGVSLPSACHAALSACGLTEQHAGRSLGHAGGPNSKPAARAVRSPESVPRWSRRPSVPILLLPIAPPLPRLPARPPGPTSPAS